MPMRAASSRAAALFVSPARQRWGRGRQSSSAGAAVMGHTYSSNFVHCVFSTKDRLNSVPENIRERLYAYIYGIARNLHIPILALGGTENHVAYPSGITREP